jgi:hypothetical protein
MSLRNRVVLPIVALLPLSFLVACGSGSPAAVPPPGGTFSNSSLKGTYVFSVVGSDSVGNFLAMTGTLTADGNGNLSGGPFDVNNPNGAGLVQGLTAQSGSSYRVTVDGRGTATIVTTAGKLGFDFVLNSSQGGLITEFDSNGTGSGTLDLQSSVSQADIAGSYAFSFSGTSGIGPALCNYAPTGAVFVIPIATVGAVTLDSGGAITAGLQDLNNNCNSTSLTALPVSGSVSLATVPGIATLHSAGNFTFDVYPISSSHLKFIETDSTGIVTAGDAITQAASIPAGANVFTLAGFDVTMGGPFTAAGVIDTDGSGNVTGGAEDINDAGGNNRDTQVTSFTGSYTALAGGRSVLSLTGFNNGAGGVTGNYQFAIYPYSGGWQVLEIDGAGITSGVAYAQTPAPLASPEGFALNLTGSNQMGEEDDIAEFVNDNGTLTGLIDFNDQNSTFGEQLTPDQRFSGTYTAGQLATGRSTIASNSFNLVSYPIDASTSVFVEVDSTQVGLGSFSSQNAGAMSNAAMRHFAVLRLKPASKQALNRR